VGRVFGTLNAAQIEPAPPVVEGALRLSGLSS